MQKIQVFLREDQRAALKALASRTGQKQSDLIRRSVDKFLEDGAREDRNWRQAAQLISGLWRDRGDLAPLDDFRESVKRRFGARG